MKYILIILFSFNLFAQNVWYVDRDATGSYTGRSWANAWTDFDSVDYWGNGTGINWAIIQPGDTIYVSGGSDSTCYNTNSPNGIEIGNVEGTSQIYTFASGNPVVIAPAWHSGHNGDVYFVSDNDNDSQVLSVGNISNLKITGIKIWDRRTLSGGGMVKLGDADQSSVLGSDIDSLITLDNCYIYSKGFASLISLNGTKNTISNCTLVTERNLMGFEQDQFGINGGRGGHTIIGNKFYTGNHFVNTNYTANGAVTVGANSFTDTRLSMSTNVYMGTFILVGDTVYMVVTSNDGDTFYGTGGWLDLDANPSSAPPNGTAYTHASDAHRDGIQISNVGYPYGVSPNERLTTTVANNLYVDAETEGTGWNNMFYSYGDTGTTNTRYVVYNNIFVNRRKDNAGAIALGRFYIGSTYNEFVSMYILNNTFITNGGDGGVMASWAIDTLVIRNNLFVKDTSIAANIYNLENYTSYWNAAYKDIDHNHYAIQGGSLPATFAFTGAWNTWAEWNTAGWDNNSSYGNSTGVTFVSKYDTSITDYYTTTGRDAGADLSATYPFLSTDILGNSRSGTWDLGALEYQAPAPSPIGKRRRMIITQ